jgi:hypothetical protein
VKAPVTAAAQRRHDEAVARLLDARVEQGLGPTITDPVALDRAAVLFATESETN